MVSEIGQKVLWLSNFICQNVSGWAIIEDIIQKELACEVVFKNYIHILKNCRSSKNVKWDKFM